METVLAGTRVLVNLHLCQPLFDEPLLVTVGKSDHLHFLFFGIYLGIDSLFSRWFTNDSQG